jgi:hypothetical protein
MAMARTAAAGNEIPESWNRSTWQRIRPEIRVLYILHRESQYLMIAFDSPESKAFIRISNDKVFRAYLAVFTVALTKFASRNCPQKFT